MKKKLISDIVNKVINNENKEEVRFSPYDKSCKCKYKLSFNIFKCIKLVWMC